MQHILFLGLLLLSCLALSALTSEEEQSSTSSGRGSFKILSNNVDSLKIPFTFHNGKPVMELEINNKKAKLMIDNGVLWDQVWLFGSSLVEELKLLPEKDFEIGGAGEGDPTQAFTAVDLTLKFKDILFFEQPVLVSPPVAGFAKMFPGVDGQLCNTFFKHFIVEFDFQHNIITLHKPETFSYNGTGSVVDMKENDNGSFSVPFSFTMHDGKTYSNRVDIDFGGIYPLKIALNNKHDIKIPFDAEETASYGAQGKSSEFKGKIQSMTLGKYTFENVTTIFGDKNSSRIHPDNLGVIGLPLFMKFNIIFDYFDNHIYLDPNENFDKAFK